MRKGELLGLRKADLDFEQRTINVARSYDNETTKSGHWDLIPMAEPLVPVLKRACALSGSELVFHHRRLRAPPRRRPPLRGRGHRSNRALGTGATAVCCILAAWT